MAAENERRRPPSNTRLLQTILAVLVTTAIIAGLIYFLTTFQSPAVSGSSLITFRISGTARTAVITYSKPDGTIIEPTGVNVPWEMRPTRFRSGIIIVLTAALTAEEKGSIKCTILSGNKIVNENTLAPFKDKAVCGAVVK